MQQNVRDKKLFLMAFNISEKPSKIVTYLCMHVLASLAIIYLLSPSSFYGNTTLVSVFLGIGTLLFILLNAAFLVEKAIFQGKKLHYRLHFLLACIISGILLNFFFGLCMQITFNVENDISPKQMLNSQANNINQACHLNQDILLMLPATPLNKNQWLVLCPPSSSVKST